MKEIFEYTDYRIFLRDFFSEQKKSFTHFSYAFFAQKVGIKSRSFICKVINGEKSLSRANVILFAQALKLGKKETEYFENMVFFNEAKTLGEKNYYYKKMCGSHKNQKAMHLRRDQFDYFSKWYHVPLRELVSFVDFKEDYKMLGSMLTPPLTAKMAKDGVDLLLRLNLIRKEGGRYVQASSTVTTGDEVQSLAVQNFHRENMALAAESLDRHDRSTRDISSITVATDKQGFEELKKEVQAFRKRMLEIVSLHEPADRVYQLNIQLYPYSIPEKEKHNA